MADSDRINNLSARLRLNNWLAENGLQPIAPEADHVTFATEFRRQYAKTVDHPPFTQRADACHYIRTIARQLRG